MKFILFAFASTAAMMTVDAAAGSPGCGQPINITVGQISVVQNIEVDGVTREFYVYLPSSYSSASSPLPVIIAYHGWNGNGASLVVPAGLAEAADSHGFIVAAPNGYADVSFKYGRSDLETRFRSCSILKRAAPPFPAKAGMRTAPQTLLGQMVRHAPKGA